MNRVWGPCGREGQAGGKRDVKGMIVHREGMVRKGSLALGAVLLVLAGTWGAEKSAEVKGTPVRELSPAERNAGRQALEEGRQLFEKYRAAYPAGARRSAEEAAAFDRVASAFQTVIEKYPGTEFEAEGRTSLIGVFRYRGDDARATENVETIRRQFAGTRHESEAYFSMGLDLLQRSHDPAAAMTWLEKIPMPPVANNPDMTPAETARRQEARKTHVSVQQLLAKCEIELGKPDQAEARYEKLARLFPELKPSLERSLEFEVESALGNQSLKDVRPTLAAWQAKNIEKKADAEEKRWGPEAGGLRASIEIEPGELRVGDPFVIRVKIRNVSDQATYLYYPEVYPAENLVVQNEKGEVLKMQKTARYEMPDPKRSFRLIQAGEAFAAEIKGRVAFKFVRAADLPEKAEDRPILTDFHDVACEIARPGRFTAALQLVAEPKLEAQGKRLGPEPVWTGTLHSNTVEFSVRTMSREEMDRVIARLRTGTPDQKQEAIEVIKANGDRAAVRDLMKIFAAGIGPHLRAASDALVAIQDPSILPDLRDLFTLSVKYPARDAGESQSAILLTIRGLEADRQKVNAFFVEVLASEASVEARCTAAWELAMGKDPKVLPALIEAARKREPRMQWTAIDVLANLGGNLAGNEKGRVSGPLIEILKTDPEGSVRGRAASALGRVSDKSAVPALIEALKDPDPFAGSYAAHSLGILADPEAIPALAAYEKSVEKESQKDAARKAIDAIRRRAGIEPKAR